MLILFQLKKKDKKNVHCQDHFFRLLPKSFYLHGFFEHIHKHQPTTRIHPLQFSPFQWGFLFWHAQEPLSGETMYLWAFQCEHPSRQSRLLQQPVLIGLAKTEAWREQTPSWKSRSAKLPRLTKQLVSWCVPVFIYFCENINLALSAMDAIK